MATGRWMAVAGMLLLAGCGGGEGGGQGGDGGGGGGQPVCGDGRVDPGELCDDGNDVDTDACLGTCELAACGDGFVRDGLEACDDGNLEAGDGCSAVCLLETLSFCGDGITDEGEACDDGNDVETDACLPTCENARCGDGIVWENLEDCDDGNTEDHDGCSASCQFEATPEAVCGNGVPETGEGCDDGNDVNTDACLDTCAPAACGDGFVRAGVEACDDGNIADGDGCSASCEVEQQPGPVCGNGVLETGEACDDGNVYEPDACSATCDEERAYEVEVNDDVRWPDSIASGGVVLGSIAAGDVDHYRFLARAGESHRLMVTAPGEACDPETAPALQLVDPKGVPVDEVLAPCEPLELQASESVILLVRVTPTVSGLRVYTLAMR